MLFHKQHVQKNPTKFCCEYHPTKKTPSPVILFRIKIAIYFLILVQLLYIIIYNRCITLTLFILKNVVNLLAKNYKTLRASHRLN